MAFSPQNPCNVLKNRNAVLKLQKRSPIFRDIHREKFKSRIKSNRGEFMNRLRHMTRDEVQQTLLAEDEMIWSAIKYGHAISKNTDPTEEYFDLESEVEEWVMQQYEEYMAKEEGILNSLIEINYPEDLLSMICKCEKLVCNGTPISCDRCNVSLPPATKVDDSNVDLQAGTDSHNTSCSQQPFQAVCNMYMAA